MTLIITAESHLDHGLPTAHITFIFRAFEGVAKPGLVIATFDLPEDLPNLHCDLYGPIYGHPPVEDGKHPVHYEKRGGWAYKSRMVKWRPLATNLISVISGPHGDHPHVLYTAYCGPVAPWEPEDPALPPEKLPEAKEFWSKHALASLQHE